MRQCPWMGRLAGWVSGKFMCSKVPDGVDLTPFNPMRAITSNESV